MEGSSPTRSTLRAPSGASGQEIGVLVSVGVKGSGDVDCCSGGVAPLFPT